MKENTFYLHRLSVKVMLTAIKTKPKLIMVKTYISLMYGQNERYGFTGGHFQALIQGPVLIPAVALGCHTPLHQFT